VGNVVEKEEKKRKDNVDDALRTQEIFVVINDRIILKQVILKKILVIKTKQYLNK
jgi:hypothetical protein